MERDPTKMIIEKETGGSPEALVIFPLWTEAVKRGGSVVATVSEGSTPQV